MVYSTFVSAGVFFHSAAYTGEVERFQFMCVSLLKTSHVCVTVLKTSHVCVTVLKTSHVCVTVLKTSHVCVTVLKTSHVCVTVLKTSHVCVTVLKTSHVCVTVLKTSHVCVTVLKTSCVCVTVLKTSHVCHCVEDFMCKVVSPLLGSSGSPDPFASIPLPSCDPQLSEGLLLPLMGPGESPPLVTRRCWDSSEPHRPDYGPPSLDLVSGRE